MGRIQVNSAKQVTDMIEDFWDDRVGFAKHICNMTPSDQQGDTLRALDEHDNVAVKAGHETGKSAGEAVAILHYASTRYPFKMPCTAPSKHQLYDVLWSELSMWHKKMNPVYGDMFIWTKEYFRHKENPEECFAAARTATKDNPESMQGFHKDYVFRVIDEASAVPDSVFEVLEGATGIYETKELMCGNPTRLEGQFFRAFGKEKKFYKLLTQSSIDSPFIPERYVERMAQKWGVDSNMYRIRVLGEFPMQEGDSFIPYHLAYDAAIRDFEPVIGAPITLSVDVARYGDDVTSISPKQGDYFHPLHILNQKNTMQIVNYVAVLANRLKPVTIFVDVIGIGAGVFDRLYELGYPVVPVNVAESPAYHPERYRRLRDELWGSARDWLEARRGKICDNDDFDLVGELTSLKYTIQNGLIVVEGKEHAKKRGIPSPNRADSMIMHFANPTMSYVVPEGDIIIDHQRQDDYFCLDREAGY